MEITASPRPPARRRQDVLDRLAREEDIWVATADADGLPCLVPLWFVWHEESVWLWTRPTNPTGRNLRDGGRVRLALGHTRDVVLIDGEAEAFGAREAPPGAAGAFLAKTGWDPREERASYACFRVRPLAVQAWHEQHELKGRHLMRDGSWTV
ncbi:pyridoxamine 5'-phosphate oxidase family protein [Streptomyces sp. NPDC056568]|uniref:pyridoxamine 5'-phosphate oxidase family protein n=1 Tax=Streptomyces sp. NPDC056568 TaxID=3345866 RepID=UPI00368D29C7